MRKPGEEEGRACKRQARREAGHAKGRTGGRHGAYGIVGLVFIYF